MIPYNFKQVSVSILAIGFCFFFPHFFGVMFIYPVIILIAIALILKFLFNETFADLFFSFKQFHVKAIWIGLISAGLLSFFFRFAWDPIVNWALPQYKYDLSDMAFIKGNPVNYAIIMVMALLVGGFYEEIVFHGLFFTRLERIISGRYATVLSFIATNVIFGLYHYQQGMKGVLLTAIAGSAYHLLILRYGRNLWYGLFCHTFFDFIGLTLIYLGYLQ